MAARMDYHGRSTGREGTLPHRCRHAGPLLMDPADGEGPYRARCLSCGMVGEEGSTFTEAVRALQQQPDA